MISIFLQRSCRILRGSSSPDLETIVNYENFSNLIEPFPPLPDVFPIPPSALVNIDDESVPYIIVMLPPPLAPPPEVDELETALTPFDVTKPSPKSSPSQIIMRVPPVPSLPVLPLTLSLMLPDPPGFPEPPSAVFPFDADPSPPAPPDAPPGPLNALPAAPPDPTPPLKHVPALPPPTIPLS